MEKGSRGGWQHRVGGDIATVIISWLIDPVELDGGSTVCIQRYRSRDWKAPGVR